MIKKHKCIFIVALCFIILCVICSSISIWYELYKSPNRDLTKAELKAYFRPTIHLNFYPDADEIGEVQIGGAVSMSYYDKSEHGNAIYNKKQYIKQITEYLNNIKLAKSTKEELPNISPDSFVQYFDNNGELIKNYIIYGQVFIQDSDTGILYRVKNTRIIKGLEGLKFN